MSSNEEPLFDAVAELNRRLARSHRRMTAMAAFAAVVSGLAGATYTATVIAVAAAPLSASFLFGAMGAMVVTDFVSRTILDWRKQTWAHDLSERFGVSRDEILSFALPFGALPGGSRKRRNKKRTRDLTLGALLFGSMIAFGVVTAWSTSVEIVLVLLAVAGAVAFNRYLGWRPPS
jgi:hypothetical protein